MFATIPIKSAVHVFMGGDPKQKSPDLLQLRFWHQLLFEISVLLWTELDFIVLEPEPNTEEILFLFFYPLSVSLLLNLLTFIARVKKKKKYNIK